MSPLRPCSPYPTLASHGTTVFWCADQPFPSIYLSFYYLKTNQPPTGKWRTTEKCAMVSYWKIGLDVVLQLCPPRHLLSTRKSASKRGAR